MENNLKFHLLKFLLNMLSVKEAVFHDNSFHTKNIYCEYSVEVPQWALVMSTHNICFMEKSSKLSQNYQIHLVNKSLQLLSN